MTATETSRSDRWLKQAAGASGRVGDSLEGGLRQLARPARQRQLRRVLLVLLLAWLLWSLARLLWSLFPTHPAELPPQPGINPAVTTTRGEGPAPVDIEALRGRHLFGEAGAVPAPVVEPLAPAQPEREGIEKGARETRLDLVLRGAVASSDDGMGHAIIEHRKQQAVYAVEDKLPVSGQVILAKVMPRQVVLDNNGTYELLTLFEDSELDGQVDMAAAPMLRAPTPEVVDKRSDAEVTGLAREYRDRLYMDPQSLAQVVTVAAVRENGDLLGYRVTPGQDKEQFAALGFQPGDMVTSVNGITLDDPANTVELYQVLRTAGEAQFDVMRGRQQVSISVSLGEPQ